MNTPVTINDKIQIGQKFKTQGKYPRECVVVDILRTYNSKDELVQVRYVAQHEFMGQIMTDYEVPASTILRGKI